MPKHRRKLSSKTITAVIIFLSLVLAAAAAPAQTKQVSFDHLTIENGLSQNSVTCLHKDSRGYLWFGTYDGLNKFDGYEMTAYYANPLDPGAIGGNLIQCITEDPDGHLLIGASEGGLNRYNRLTDSFDRYRHNPNNSNTISDDFVHCIFFDRSGRMWIGTNNGLDRVDLPDSTFSHYYHNPEDSTSLVDNIIKSIVQDRDGDIWVATNGDGIHRYDPHTDSFVRLNSSFPGRNINGYYKRLLVDSQNRLWITSNLGGLFCYDKTTGIFERFNHDPNDSTSLSHNNVMAIVENRDGTFWVATDGGGLTYFQPVSETFTTYSHDPNQATSLSTNQLLALYIDDTDILWIGTFSGGVNSYDQNRQRFTVYRYAAEGNTGLSNKSVLAIFEDSQGEIWIGTDGGGLNQFDPVKKTFTHIKHDPTDPNSLGFNVIKAICEDNRGHLLLGTWSHGLEYFDRQNNVFSHYNPNNLDLSLPQIPSSNDVWALLRDHQDRIWVGTLGGCLDIFDPITRTFAGYCEDPEDPYSFPTTSVMVLLEDSHKQLWIGTSEDGLFYFDEENMRFHNFTFDPSDPHSISSNVVRAITEDCQGNLWIGTQGGGLNLFNPKDQTFTSFSIADGLPSKSVVGILEDDHGYLWLSTLKGLAKFNPHDKTCQTYTVQDGLQSDEFNYTSLLKSRTGEMYFGGINGLNVFHPDSICDNSYVPPVVITDFQIFNESVQVGAADSILSQHISETEELTLSYRHSVLSFEFAAMNFTITEKNQYAYIMEGFDTDWHYVGNERKATYTNLDGGRYVFRVKASNNDGVWNEQGVSLKIRITPPFWQTFWFRLIIIGIIIFIAISIHRVRTRLIQEQKKILKRKVQERTAQLASANAEIQSLLEKFKEENIRMRAELDVTRRIQQMILPSDEELSHLSNLDISGYMEPADEVGGDYYDVLNEENNEIKISIGDVTGHGLESAIVMLMAQTAIRALTQSKLINDPVHMLRILNQTLYKNIHRMGFNKNMSLVILDYKMGQVRVSGFHEDILIVRQNGTIELMHTTGMWLALEEEILPYLSQTEKQIDLQPGDGIVLYSDGITEARPPDTDPSPETMYGLDRLCQVVSQNWGKSAIEVKNAIVEDVSNFVGQNCNHHDDLTLVVMKQL